MRQPPTRLLFVCLGNICRSPTAEGVMRHLLKRNDLQAALEVDSAGTGDWHVGEPPDQRSAAVGARRGMPLSGKARQVTAADFQRFDLLLAMDRSNHQNLLAMAPTPEARDKVHLLRDFDSAGQRGLDVPDPYYGGPEGFDAVFDICVAACEGLLLHLQNKDRAPAAME